MIYLDYAASTPVDLSVLEVMLPYYNEKFFNPSALYLSAKAVNSDIANARLSIAKTLGSKSSELIFTAGGTEANNLAINGIMSQFSDGNILVSSIEHDSVLEPAKQYSNNQVSVRPDGVIDVKDLKNKINDKTVLVSIMYANNEIGTVQPIREIAQIIAVIKSDRVKSGNKLPLYLHTDGAQATNYLDMHVSKLGVDLMSINGGKIYGPKQTGLLYVKTGTKLKAQILGGGQERSLRSGTENVAGIIGLSKAIQLVTDRKKSEIIRLHELQQQFIKELQKVLPLARINGSLKHRLPNNIHITIPGIDNERVMMELDERGIMCATGSACSASNDEPSHVLRAIGLSDDDARSSLRFTLGAQTSALDIKKTASALKDICV